MNHSNILDKMVIKSCSENQTRHIGKQLGRLLRPGQIICLYGCLGSGKTQFAKGLAQGLEVKADRVKSPSFFLHAIFEGRLRLNHFDLFRLESLKEILSIGFEHYIFSDSATVIEWADRLKGYEISDALRIDFKISGPEQRILTFSAKGKRSEQLLIKLKKLTERGKA